SYRKHHVNSDEKGILAARHRHFRVPLRHVSLLHQGREPSGIGLHITPTRSRNEEAKKTGCGRKFSDGASVELSGFLQTGISRRVAECSSDGEQLFLWLRTIVIHLRLSLSSLKTITSH